MNRLDPYVKRLSLEWQKLKKAQKNWDLKTWQGALTAIEADLGDLGEAWPQTQASLSHLWQERQQYLADPTYAQALEGSLQEVGLRWQGGYPQYELPPLKLVLNPDQGVVQLLLGRRLVQKTSQFAPPIVAKWVKGHLNTFLNRAFQGERLCQELVTAYELLNRLQNQSLTPQWGQSVSLFQIYEVLTLRTATRQDYSKVLFAYDLGQLRQQGAMIWKGYRLELAAVRQARDNLVFLNRQGLEERVGTLTVYAPTEVTS
ncbi:MAG: hypothetical protein OHK0012_00250 [Synechococcales cyanobacterium]